MKQTCKQISRLDGQTTDTDIQTDRETYIQLDTDIPTDDISDKADILAGSEVDKAGE